ncbi:NAD(P)/FAD-dependent oxidoreductase [Natronospora cellulosivora (SeqCode)]
MKSAWFFNLRPGYYMKYLIIGAGIAGVSAAKEILKEKEKDDKIIIITDEEYPFYYRPRLIECLSGKTTVKDLVIHDKKWFEDNNIQLNLNESVKSIQAEKKEIISDKNTYTYDKLLIANGAKSFLPPIKGIRKDNVFSLRDAKDAERIYNYAINANTAVVLGGGLLGLESAYNLSKLGLNVSVVEVMERLLPRQLDKDAAQVLKSLLEEKGLKLYLDDKVEEFIGRDKVRKLKLSSNKIINTDLVLVSAGSHPKIDLAASLDSLVINRGLKVNKYLESNIPDIYAAGDIVEIQDTVFGLWTTAQEMGKIAGLNILGNKMEFKIPVNTYKLKILGIDLISIGEIDLDKKLKSKVELEKNHYRKLIYNENDQLIGAIILGKFPDNNKLIADIKAREKES